MSSLDDLLAPWMALNTGIEFQQLALDSRRVRPGDCFIAVAGHLVDGRDYIDAAIAQGAVAVVAEAEQDGRLADRHGAIVVGLQDLSKRLSEMALRAYPAAIRPTLIGVTGTNGKTTVTQLCAQLLSALGRQAGVMGTVGNGLWGDLTPSVNTTSDAITVARELDRQAKEGADTVALEISSHGLSQARVAALPVKVGVYTNLSRDHLDYHGDMAAYAAAKRQLFTLPELTHGVLNLDDEIGMRWHRELTGQLQTLGYSAEGARCDGDFLTVEGVEYHDHGVRARVISNLGHGTLESPLLGAFNLANLLAALGALLSLGYALDDLLAVVPKLHSAAGRMECFGGGDVPTLVVDYAHTPDALSQALAALRPHCQGALWCVFGCGGERDSGKRPLMAQAAEQGADHLIITADNPRSEQFAHIVAQMEAGLNGQAEVIEDRASAVSRAFAEAQPGDMILLAGKGHEDYQIIGGERLDYNERALAQQLVEQGL
ncbi:UDP-N-acetylmuramoyl-L-alanyl-D-glutamate--2,6-diaminopimelate ligase [Ferrimonas balearica]|uniref:UDP-N-acetylmuramoyl-L-alanyl-D-glutamate--2, 6-diaminopimelate ligase n=1 Tax=Ferrimonas balearica TaxID=44012 RepID=UPI001C99F466|nr:UDP-N-acetylmuramoyl-L-alanyl-D-glutamate--2,6-diaminopimelate ligase [Ferrimonas balearica]MBY5923204.1 UDP-N-acetylmuramoyl-L-alanyl-D-glutamate--2,6-diaminopimelate ligase [Ferrimonas balearica]MBY5997420.1 UDP-N-acetylmuramoyl-L-alanyl-D-glutamate--2,6-diaminopimelate ligase [Ferrimonas balearica]